MISRRHERLRRSGFLPPDMQNTSTHTMPERHRRDLGARLKTFRDNPRPFLGAPLPTQRRATHRLGPAMIIGTLIFASMIVIIHAPSRALSSAPNDNHPTCTLGRCDARTGYVTTEPNAVATQPSTVAETIEIDLSGKYRVRVSSGVDAQALRRVLDVLERQ